MEKYPSNSLSNLISKYIRHLFRICLLAEERENEDGSLEYTQDIEKLLESGKTSKTIFMQIALHMMVI